DHAVEAGRDDVAHVVGGAIILLVAAPLRQPAHRLIEANWDRQGAGEAVGGAVVGAVVVVDHVAVVALLDAGLHEAVTTKRDGARAHAGVGVFEVAVVALLDTGLHEAITAAGRHAAV